VKITPVIELFYDKAMTIANNQVWYNPLEEDLIITKTPTEFKHNRVWLIEHAMFEYLFLYPIKDRILLRDYIYIGEL